MGVALLLEGLAPSKVLLRADPEALSAGRIKAGTLSMKSASGFFACGDLITTFFILDLDGVSWLELEVSSVEMGECPNNVRVGLSNDGCLE